jgi:hypothetical protein
VTTSGNAVDAAVAAVPLVDHHVHGALRETPDRPTLEALLTESDRPVPPWMTMFDSPLGLAIRRWCAPLLDLEPGVAAEEYVARRTALGEAEVTRRMLRHNGVEHYLVETGYAEGVLGPAEMAAAANADAGEIVRLESVFETLAAEVGAAAAVRTFPEVLAERAAAAAGLKSVVAYRFGFDFAPEPPTHAEAVAAAGSMLALAGPRGPRVGCRCSCTAATATPTSSCTAATRCCSPASSGWSSRTASTCSCCTATRTTARRATSRRCSPMSTSTSASR